jgi:hypothetical protein
MQETDRTAEQRLTGQPTLERTVSAPQRRHDGRGVTQRTAEQGGAT